MSEIPLLHKRIDADMDDCFQDKNGNVLLFSDVIKDLKKFKSAEIEYDCPENCCKCKSEDTFFVEKIDNELPKDYCFDCWF